MAVNKVIYDGNTLIDLTEDTVTADQLKTGVTAHDAAGNRITGTYEGEDVSAETAEYTEKLGVQNGVIDQIVETLKTRFAVPSSLQNKVITPTTSRQVVTADEGYDGLSVVTVESIPKSYTNQIYNSGYDLGYDTGYDTGYDEGYNLALELFKPYMVELEYIESTGTQYIDTGWSFGTNNYAKAKLVFDGYIGTASNGWAVSGVGANPTFYCGVGSGRNIYYGNGNSDINTGVTYTENRSLFEIDLQNKTVKVTDKVTSEILVDLNSITVGTPSGTRSFYLSAYNSGSAVCHSEKIYGYQIYEDEILVRDYIPVLDLNGIACLYDKVTRKLYYNAGTGSFSYAA